MIGTCKDCLHFEVCSHEKQKLKEEPYEITCYWFRRGVMAEYIDREALIAEFKRLTLGENSLIERAFADGVYTVIETFPSADVVELVRCRDCIHRVDYNGRIMCNRNACKFDDEWCGLTATNLDCFCSYGTRKTQKEG